MYINFKSKYKKFLWLIIGFLIACFYIQKVNAYTMPNGLEITDEYIQDLWDTYLKDKSPHDLRNGCPITYQVCSNVFGNSTNPFNLVNVILYQDGTTIINFARFINEVYIGPNGNKYTEFYFATDRVQYNTGFDDLQYDNYPRLVISSNGSISTDYYNGGNRITILNGSDINNYRSYYNNTTHFAINYNLIQNDNILKEANFTYPSTGPDYLNGYTKVTLPVGTQYTMISSSQITSGYVFVPLEDFNNYGGRLSYFDKDLSSQPYTSYIQDYTITPDGLYARQYFDLSSYNGADWVMFSKYIYLEGEDNITYDIWIPTDSYSSSVVVTPNNSGGNDFDFSYVDSTGELQADTISSVDLTPPQPLLGDIFQNFTSNDFGLSSIITAPLPLIQSLNSATCTDISLPLGIFGGVHDNRLVLPCMTPLYQNWLGDFFTLYQTITTGFIAYYVGLGFFNKIKQLKDPENDKIEVIDL